MNGRSMLKRRLYSTVPVELVASSVSNLGNDYPAYSRHTKRDPCMGKRSNRLRGLSGYHRQSPAFRAAES